MPRAHGTRGGLSCLLSALVLATGSVRAEAPDALAQRGEYLFRAGGCENCHTDRERKGERLAGGRWIVTPLGTFVAPNITMDPQTGIGRWREEDLRRALREGVSPKGDHYYPSFPYPAYTRLTDDDVRALYAYLRTVPSVRRENEPHELPWYLRLRSSIGMWKALYFRPGRFIAQADRSARWNRGAYLAQALAHCGECHTPRNSLGGFRQGYYLAGTREGPEGAVVPNITPHRDSGIGRWRASELVQYLESGMTPSGDFAGGLMAEFIDGGLHVLTRDDRVALAEYVLSVPAVDNIVRAPKKKEKSEY